MRVNFPTKGKVHLASHRLRTLVAAEAVGGSVGEYDPDADVHVFSKHWDELRDLGRYSPCPIFDVCDDHFTDRFGKYYRAMCNRGAVSVSSWGLADLVAKYSTPTIIRVIEEPYELPEQPVRLPEGRRLLWYGHLSNFVNLPKWLMEFEMEVLTNASPQKAGKWNITTWSPEAVVEKAKLCDAVVIPQTQKWKSANRAVDGVRLGIPVISDPVPAYEGLSFNEGVKEGIEWLSGGPTIEMLAMRQQRVRTDYCPEKIRRDWFEFISAVAKSTFRDGSTSITRERSIIGGT